MTTEPAPDRHLRWRIFPAVAIIAICVLFLLNNLGYNVAFLDQGNWWAVIIPLAALAPLTRGLEIYRARGAWKSTAPAAASTPKSCTRCCARQPWRW